MESKVLIEVNFLKKIYLKHFYYRRMRIQRMRILLSSLRWCGRGVPSLQCPRAIAMPLPYLHPPYLPPPYLPLIPCLPPQKQLNLHLHPAQTRPMLPTHLPMICLKIPLKKKTSSCLFLNVCVFGHIQSTTCSMNKLIRRQ